MGMAYTISVIALSFRENDLVGRTYSESAIRRARRELVRRRTPRCDPPGDATWATSTTTTASAGQNRCFPCKGAVARLGDFVSSRSRCDRPGGPTLTSLATA
jgi:hypothetical protein